MKKNYRVVCRTTGCKGDGIEVIDPKSSRCPYCEKERVPVHDRKG